MPAPRPSALARGAAAVRRRALALPEAVEDFPWGESAFKVRGKVFLFLHRDGEGLSFSLKLPESAGAARMLPFAEPTGYGLGKRGWITARFGPKDAPPVDLLLEWLEESYRAIAPKRLSSRLP